MTEFGIITLASLEQAQKAHSPIVLTELGITIFVRPLQWENARLPIVVTELGMVTSESAEQ